MPSDHSLWLADEFEEVTVEGGLDDTIVELNNKHILFIATKSLRDQLASLNLIIIEPLLQLNMLLQTLVDLISREVILGNTDLHRELSR